MHTNTRADEGSTGLVVFPSHQHAEFFREAKEGNSASIRGENRNRLKSQGNRGTDPSVPSPRIEGSQGDMD